MSPFNISALLLAMTVMCSGQLCCPARESAEAVLHDGTSLVKSLTTDNIRNPTYWFLPDPAMARRAVRATVSDLVALMKQRGSLEALGDSDTVVTLRTVLTAVINDSCDYLNEMFRSHMECTAEEIEDLHNRLLFVNTILDITGMLGRSLRNNSISRREGYRYDYWNSRVTSDCGSAQSSVCSSLQDVADNRLGFTNYLCDSRKC